MIVTVRRAIAILAVIAVMAAMILAPSRPSAAALRPLRVMPLGDSITFGVGTSPYDAYRKDLWLRLRNAGLPVDFVGSLASGTMSDKNHEGRIGWRIDQLTANIGTWMKIHQPDVVLLHIGTNDLGQGYDVLNAPRRLSQLIDRIRAVRPGVRIFVARIVWMVNGGEQWTKYTDAIPGVVASKGPNVHLVPHHVIGPTAGDLADGVHPSACGYAKMSYQWYSVMGRSPLNTTGRAWPAGNNPFRTTTGPCAR